ncbi:unnamed protein product [Rotaria socialis]
MDENKFLYVNDLKKDEVSRYQRGESKGTVVASANGNGNRLDQLYGPYYLFGWNNRTIRVPKRATQGSVIADGNGRGEQSNQLNEPIGLSFDRLGNLYAVDFGNHRVQKFNVDFNG